MPKFYCDYCDVYLTHDSPSVRRLHNEGWRHKTNVRSYFAQYLNNEEVIARRKKNQKKQKSLVEDNPFQVFSTNHLPFVPKSIQNSLVKAPKKPSNVDFGVLKSGRTKVVNRTVSRGGNRGRGMPAGTGGDRGRGRGGNFNNFQPTGPSGFGQPMMGNSTMPHNHRTSNFN